MDDLFICQICGGPATARSANLFGPAPEDMGAVCDKCHKKIYDIISSEPISSRIRRAKTAEEAYRILFDVTADLKRRKE